MILSFLLLACTPDAGSTWATYDQDRDGALPPEDCDDERADVNTDATEVCNGRDDDCDGEVDEDAVDALTFYEDRDGDGFGDAGAPVLACEATATTTADSQDCDDSRAEAHPRADETCNGLDDNCNGAIDDSAIDVVTRWSDDDGDGYGDADHPYVGCTVPAGYVDDDDDCDDTDADIHPDAPETDCTDPVDYNCDGRVVYADDDGDGWAACVDCDDDDAELTEPLTWYADADHDGYGDLDAKSVDCFVPDGYTDDTSDCDDTDATVSPAGAEVCDSRWTDEDCDGVADDDDASATGQTPWYSDADGDGYAGTLAAVTCHAPAATVSLPDDCDDTDADDHPGGAEVCNGDDEDCDGAIDDGVLVMFYADDDGDGYGDPFSPTYACSAPAGYVTDNTDCAPDDASVYPDASGVCVSPSIRFLVVGDTGAGDANQYTVGAAMADVCAMVGCDFILLVGDNFYPSGVTSTTDPQFQSAFELPYTELTQQFWAVMGNHDWNMTSDTMYLDAQVGYTALSPKWYMPSDYYTRTAGDVTFYALDTEMIDQGRGADQDTWLPLQRAASTTTWNIAYGHHPYRSNGPHGDADVNVATFMETNVCGQYDVYFAGHDHNLQWIEDTCGTAFLVSGAGHSAYPLGGTNPVYFEADSLGFLWVEIEGRDFTGVFYDETGTELYRRTFSK